MITKENFNIALTPESKVILKKILDSGILPEDVYLAGGTAVAMYYGHRLSAPVQRSSVISFTDLYEQHNGCGYLIVVIGLQE